MSEFQYVMLLSSGSMKVRCISLSSIQVCRKKASGDDIPRLMPLCPSLPSSCVGCSVV